MTAPVVDPPPAPLSKSELALLGADDYARVDAWRMRTMERPVQRIDLLRLYLAGKISAVTGKP
jgi:hypothetical protein